MKKLHLICNAHLDPVWQWTWDEGIAAAVSTFKTAADLCDEFDYVFCHNEALLYEAVEKYAPELFLRIKKLVADGKWRRMGGWYIQPDCNLPCGESFVRQIKAGQRYFKEKFGVTPTVACNFDSFGHSVGLVQIMKKCGYTGYIHHRPWDSVFEYPGRFFDWIGPDGSKITVCRVDSYGSGLGHAAEKILRASENAEDVDVVLWGVGNHGGGPSRKDLRDIEELIKNSDIQIVHSCPEALFADSIKISGEVKTSLVPAMPGCYTSMMRVKQANRQTESLIYSTEKLMSIASLCGFTFDEKPLCEAEKKMLFAQFHDILPGSSVPDGEKEGLELLASASRTFRDERTRALLYMILGERKAQNGEYPIFVFNPNPYELQCPVEAEFSLADQNWNDSEQTLPHVFYDGKEIPSQQIKEKPTINLDWRKRVIFEGALKPMGITRFDVKTEVVEKQKKRESGETLENALKNCRVLSEPVTLRMYDDTADPWAMSMEEHLNSPGTNATDFREMTAEESSDFCKVAALKPCHVIEDGDVYTGIERFFVCRNTKAVTEYRFYKNHPYVDLKVTVEFFDKNSLIRLKIPVPSDRLCGDGPYVTEYKQGAEVSFQKWLGVENNGVISAVVNDGIYGGKYCDGALELTLLRGSGYLFHPIGDRELYSSDRYLPRIDCGRYEFNFRIITGDAGEVTRCAEEFSVKPYGINIFPLGSGEHTANISTSKPVVMPVCKTTQSGTVMRFYNPEARTDSFTLNVNENRCEVTALPHEVVSVVYNKGKFAVHHDDMPL